MIDRRNVAHASAAVHPHRADGGETDVVKRIKTLVQLTDTHLVGDGERLFGAVDPAANLQRALDSIGRHGDALDAILLTGDLANDGDPDAYRHLRSAVDAVASRRGVPAYYGMGNHDDRAAFRAELLGGAAAPTGTTSGGTASSGEDGVLAPVDYVIDLDGLRIVMVDSTRPGHHFGEVTAEQHAWLRTILAEPAPHGTLLTIHHPPFPFRAGAPDADLLAEATFHDVAAFADTVRGSDVMTILSGHLHEPLGGNVAGVPVWAGASTTMAHEVSADRRAFRIVANCGLSLIDVYDDRTVVARAVNCLDRPVLFETTMEQLLQAT